MADKTMTGKSGDRHSKKAPHEQSAQELATACADAMLAHDHATKNLGMQLLQTTPGGAVLSMVIGKTMLNGHGTCHGGFIFTLADSAFAFACNSYNAITVAAAADISFLAPAFEGDTLTATAVEQFRAGRSGIYDVTVTNADGKTIALFRGKSRTISDRGPLDG